MTSFHLTCKYCNVTDKNHESYDYFHNYFSKLIDVSDVNEQDESGRTGLHYAAQFDRFLVVSLILEIEGVINCVDSLGNVAIHLAAQEGHINIIKILSSKFPKDILIKNFKGQNILHLAALDGHHVFLYNVLSENLDLYLSDVDNNGNNLLHLAVESKSLNSVKYILEDLKLGNKLHKPNNRGDLPIHKAAKANFASAIEIIVKFCPVCFDDVNINKETALHIASSLGFDKVATLLIQLNADLNIENFQNETPIMTASRSGQTKIISLLLDHQAELNQRHRNSDNVVHILIRNNQPVMLKKLLERNDINNLLYETTVHNETPIHIAAKIGNKCLDIMFSCKAINEDLLLAKNIEGETPCHIAAKHCQPHKIQLIYDHFPNTIYEKDNDRNTPLHIAALHNQIQCFKVLIRNDTQLEQENYQSRNIFDCAALSGCTESLDILIKLGALERYSFIPNKTNALHLAAANGNRQAVNMLLKNRFDINTVDENNMTALQLAMLNKHRSVVEVIIDGKFWKESLKLVDKPTGNTPMKGLIRDYPDLAEKVMDKCISIEKGNELQGDIQLIEDDPRYIDEIYIKNGDIAYKSTKNHPLMIMIEKKEENLLNHPLCLMWIQRQWSSYARYMFAAEACSYLLFLIFLSCYSFVSFDKSAFDIITNSSTIDVKGLIEKRNTKLKTPEIGLAFMLGFNMLFEITQIRQLKKFYINIKNFIDWTLFIMSFVLLVTPELDEKCFGKDGCSRLYWKRPLAAVLLVVSWLNFLRYLRYFSFYGIFLQMFVNIFKTVFKLCLMMAVFVLAFSFGFHLSLINREEFSDFGWAYMKTLVMSSGEYEYDSVLREGEIFNAPVVIIIFIAMLIVMSVVLMNMLIGIAVDDISKVQQEAELQKISSQIIIALSTRRPLQKNISSIMRKYNPFGGKSNKQKLGVIKVKLQRLNGMNHIMSDDNISKLYYKRKDIQKIATMDLLSDKIDSLQQEVANFGRQLGGNL